MGDRKLLHSGNKVAEASSWVLVSGAALIAVAPLIRGGNRHVALIALECLALLLLLGVAAKPWGEWKWRWGNAHEVFLLLTLMTAPLWIGLAQLTPLPGSLWATLSGEMAAGDVLPIPGVPAEKGWRPLSLYPDATWASALAGLPMMACFVLALAVSPRQLRRFCHLWIGLAVAQACIGLLQIGPLPGLYFGSLFEGTIGTFANSNHFANFIVMTLPLAVMEFRRALYDLRRESSQRAVTAWGVLLFVLLLAWLASLSRGAMVSGALVLVAVWMLIPVSSSARISKWHTFGFFAAVLVALGVVGLSGVERFFGEQLHADAQVRTLVRSATWSAAQDFWPAGSGLGTFAAVFPRYQPATIQEFVPHAHSDYVQLLMEVGVFVIPFAAAFLWLSVVRVFALYRAIRHGVLDDEGRRQTACALGLLALLLHSCVDFNLHIPANAMLGAFMAGTLFRRRSSGPHPHSLSA